MTYDEYESSGHILYGDFAEAISGILRAALGVHPSIKVQQIQFRAKDPRSLKSKLEKAGLSTDASIDEGAKDLAGCRLILYSNSDVRRLDTARILSETFSIVWERTKLHYPRSDSGAGVSQFIGDNYVVRLSKDREALPEYRRFAGLLCEIQVQTILNHAWSETAHDTIYKRPALNGIGAGQMARIESRLEAIQQNYLLPAGYEFQKVLNDFERLSAGQRLVDGNILAAIRDAPDNNARVEVLEKYEKHVLPLIDDPESVVPDIRAALVACAVKAFESPLVPIETPIGSMPGRTAAEVTEKALSILGAIKYVDPADAFEALVSLYCGAPSDQIREIVRKAVSDLARHELEVWRKAGPFVQEVLVDAIGKTPPDQLGRIAPLAIDVAEQCLLPEVTGTSSTSSTFTWQTGAVQVSDRLNAVRDRAIQMLMEVFRTAANDCERREIVGAMKCATRLPNQGNYGDDLVLRALRDSTTLVAFLTAQVEVLGNDHRESLENWSLFLYRRNRDMPADMLKGEGVRVARDGLTARILEFRDALNAIPDFVIFKTLVGYEAVFRYEWDREDRLTDVGENDHYRKEKIDELRAGVTEATADEWFDRLNRYAAVKSNDLATFPYMGGFIADIAGDKPAIARKWLTRAEGQPLEDFKPGLLRGLYASDPGAATAYVEGAISEGRDLSGVMKFLRWAEPFNPMLFEQAFMRSIETGNVNAVFQALESVVSRPEEVGQPLADRVFVESVEYLNGGGHYGWIRPVATWGRAKGLLTSLREDAAARLLKVIGNLPKIGFSVEEVLTELARRFPQQVIELFGQRLAHERREEDDTFEAIPFDFYRLHEAMSGQAAFAVDRAIEWSGNDGHLVEFRSARLIAIMFPKHSDEFERKLIECVQSGDRARQEFVVSVMRNLKGKPIVYAVMRELVAVLPVGDQLLGGVEIALSERGVLHGEFGYRDALVDQKAAMESWRDDERERVRAFANDAIRTLDNQIAAAQRGAEEDIAMRRLLYGEPIVTAPESPPSTDGPEAESAPQS